MGEAFLLQQSNSLMTANSCLIENWEKKKIVFQERAFVVNMHRRAGAVGERVWNQEREGAADLSNIRSYSVICQRFSSPSFFSF